MDQRTSRLAAGLLLVALLLSTAAAGASGVFPAPDRLEAHLSLGHDDNLLDLSDVEQATFASGDPAAFFAVDRMSDQFCEGGVEGGWEPPLLPGIRSTLILGGERRQYLHAPIRSENRFALELRLRRGATTRVDLKATLRPQTYARHRFDRNALPEEPQFRPEVHRRWDFEIEARQAAAWGTTLDGFLGSSTRRYRAPFEERDRESFGGGGGVSRSLGSDLRVRAGAGYRATWTENEPWDPDDRSHRAWRASSRIESGGVPFLASVRLDVEFEWRRFTSEDPADRDHFGRSDRAGDVEIEIVRRLGGALDGIGGAAWHWRNSDFPVAAFDEEGELDDAVFHAGVRWAWKAPGRNAP